MIANRKGFRPYASVVAVGLFLSTFLAARGEVSASGVRLLGGNEVVSMDVSCDTGATTCPTGLAPGGVARQTSPRGINARGDIVGFYVDSAGRQHGFLRHDGLYATIDFPLAGVRARSQTASTPKAKSSANTCCRSIRMLPKLTAVLPAESSQRKPQPRLHQGFSLWA